MTIFVSAVTPVYAHGGGTDSNGCHNDRKNGGYHCH
ncbi:YHYH domain-containing protein [Rhizobium sullae]|uniref:YHYH domain-containing protein n=1 Tax=Rhizobium sullae TaxID=50338 RepID=A0A2N0D794_RHISU|nr:YHYH domain-containing protein [Rhizobium sullae]PKA41969.1 YHYH domain-containing protein [Rhizobium sullae]